MKVEIRITNHTGEFVVMKHQLRDKLGRPLVTQKDVLTSACADARTWLARNGTEVENRR